MANLPCGHKSCRSPFHMFQDPPQQRPFDTGCRCSSRPVLSIRMWSPRCTAITSTKDVTSTCAALNYRTLPPVWQMPLTFWQIPRASPASSFWHSPLQQSTEASQPNFETATHCRAGASWQMGRGGSEPRARLHKANTNSFEAQGQGQLTVAHAPAASAAASFWQWLPRQQSTEALQPNLSSAIHCKGKGGARAGHQQQWHHLSHAKLPRRALATYRLAGAIGVCRVSLLALPSAAVGRGGAPKLGNRYALQQGAEIA